MVLLQRLSGKISNQHKNLRDFISTCNFKKLQSPVTNLLHRLTVSRFGYDGNFYVRVIFAVYRHLFCKLRLFSQEIPFFYSIIMADTYLLPGNDRSIDAEEQTT